MRARLQVEIDVAEPVQHVDEVIFLRSRADGCGHLREGYFAVDQELDLITLKDNSVCAIPFVTLVAEAVVWHTYCVNASANGDTAVRRTSFSGGPWGMGPESASAIVVLPQKNH